MNYIKFNEWQEMALKKDTEAILRKLDSNQPVLLSMCWDLVISSTILLVDHLFASEETKSWAWSVGIAMAVIPPLVILLYKFISFLKAIARVRKGKLNVKGFIDLFDNQICYWVMTGNSYGKMLLKMKKNNTPESVFFYQECCYYNNKAIVGLYKILPIINKIFTNDPVESVKKGTIQLQRLVGILKVIDKNSKIVQNFESKFENIEGTELLAVIKEQKVVNEKYRAYLKDFESEKEKVFKI